VRSRSDTVHTTLQGSDCISKFTNMIHQERWLVDYGCGFRKWYSSYHSHKVLNLSPNLVRGFIKKLIMLADGFVSEFDFLAIRWMHEWADHTICWRQDYLCLQKKLILFWEHESSSSKVNRYAIESIYMC
jgi:hypothetical protein